jgi:alpha-L-fucosidase
MIEPCTRRTFLKAAGIAAASLGAPGLGHAAERYELSWSSLARHQTPAWFADAKFGIYFHWGIYSVPAFDNEWYSRNMYIPGSRANKFHNLVYGPPAKFGYKDFIPMFHAEKFNPEEWAELLRKSGAKFAGPVSEHADGFSMWNSKVNPWNAARMGPKRDVVGEMSRALRNEGLKFLATFHHQWLWGWYPTTDKAFDCSDPRYAGLYGPPAPESAYKQRNPPPTPPESFQQEWEAKVLEVIDHYHPDHVYFDSRLEIIDEARRKHLLAYYYNQAAQRGQPVSLSYKTHGLPAGVAVLDIEAGRMANISPHPWLEDDLIDWTSWCYVQNPQYKSADRVVGQLADLVSKNGTLLLDINPSAEGVMPEPTVERLLAIGKWLETNGEAIYGTRPWKIFGEGPTEVAGGSFGEKKIPHFTPQDFRFTSRPKTLYAINLGWPAGEQDVVIKSLGAQRGLLAQGETANVALLGSDEKLTWRQTADGLRIKLPSRKPGNFAYTYKISLA